uniref:Uncharacterized protein n=1 Tax=Romanomermis culicivorax TaxID=13658 RepID=A0A915HQE4_ROMCU
MLRLIIMIDDRRSETAARTQLLYCVLRISPSVLKNKTKISNKFNFGKDINGEVGDVTRLPGFCEEPFAVTTPPSNETKCCSNASTKLLGARVKSGISHLSIPTD